MEPIKSPRRNRAIVWLSATALAAGLGIGAASIASAAAGTDSSSTSTSNTITANTVAATDSQSVTPPAQVDPASLPNGPGETVLTGDTASKVTAAALAAEPGATVVRVETDSSGHTYEAHVKLADGTYKTLYFDSSFAADGSDTGFGGGPQGGGHQGGGHGQPPADQTATTTASNG